ncbi:MAG: PBP1A family penicillin-binding protein [Desulfobacterales bacterium]|nr:MAG: PBP1A family penicillin-binding protein [Desulfobacterales bacterium]
MSLALIACIKVILGGRGALRIIPESWPTYRIVETASNTARWTIELYERLLGRKLFSLRALVTTLALSISLTTAAIVCGRIIEQLSYLAVWMSISRNMASLMPFSGKFYRSELLYPFKFLIDYLSIAVTLSCLHNFRKNPKFSAKILSLLANLAFMSLTIFVCLFGIKALSTFALNGVYELRFVTNDLQRTITTFSQFLLRPFHEWYYGNDFDSFFFSLTVSAPLLVFYALLPVVLSVTLACKLFRSRPGKISGVTSSEGLRLPPTRPSTVSSPSLDDSLTTIREGAAARKIHDLYPRHHNGSGTIKAKSRNKIAVAKIIKAFSGALVWLYKFLLIPLSQVVLLLLIVAAKIFKLLWPLAVAVFLFSYYIYDSLPDTSQFDDVASRSRIIIRKKGDRVDILDAVNHLQVSSQTFPKHLVDALLAMEDRRFYDHWGIDWVGIARAVYHRIAKGRIEGGSTITQQLAKNMFLSSERSLLRKAKEAVLAFKLEWSYSKAQILEMYLNQIYFGNDTYGVETAARKYFQKRAERLTLYEAALLVGSIPKPNVWNIIDDEHAARQRAGLVLSQMVKAGYISLRQALNAKATGWQPGAKNLRRIEYRYLMDWIAPDIRKHCKGVDGYLVVVTTLDPEVQLYAELAVERMLDGLENRQVSQAALLAMDPDGAVRAMVGGRSYGSSQYNRTVQALRQPGSAFKPLVYLAALENGWQPEDMILDAPISIGKWRPRNHDDRYLGRITLKSALRTSRNTATVRLCKEVGPKKVVSLAARLGISSVLPQDLGVALGIGEVSILELTRAYAVFANGGYASIPYGIVLIRDRLGNIIYKHESNAKQQIVDRDCVTKLNRMLAAVVSPSGTGRKAAFGRHQTGGKTGTTQQCRDAWFVGYTSHLVSCVWAGNDDNLPTDGVLGGEAPARAWRNFMANVHHNLDLAAKPLP